VTEVVFSVTEVHTKTTKKREIFIFAKAPESEICTRIGRRYLTSFAGLHFENLPGSTELDTTEDRQNSQLCVSKPPQQRKRNSQYRDEGIIRRGLMWYHNSN